MVANDWKDANDKVMPVKQWLEERRFMQVIKYALTSWLCAIVWSEQSCSIQLISVFKNRGYTLLLQFLSNL